MQFGVYTFVETERDPRTGGRSMSSGRSPRRIEEIELADRVGLDVFALGEHHRPDYAVSAPAVALAYAAARTEGHSPLQRRHGAVSSDDPVRVYQQFATLDLLSGGRAEIMAGRGSFIELFPLFGYDLDDYDELFAEKLDLLLAIRAKERVTWKAARAPLNGLGVYPRALQNPLPVWIAVGGTPQSVARAGALGLPLALAIIGGEPARFAPIGRSLSRGRRARRASRPSLALGINGHGFLADTSEEAIDAFYEPYAETMSRIGRERGWPA